MLNVARLQIYLELEFPDGVRQLVIFRRQYLQRINAKHLLWPPEKLLRIYDVQRWVYDFINNPWHSKSRTRQDTGFLTELVKRIENAVANTAEPDIYDPLVELCAELCAQPRLSDDDSAQQDVWVLYETASTPDLTEDQHCIKLFEKPRVLSAAGCSGYRTWQAALALAKSIATKWIPQKLLNKKNVLELGAGTGLLSFLCASSGGAERVVVTDGDEDAIRRLVISDKANERGKLEVTSRTRFGVYLWGEPFEGTVIGEELQERSFDVILAADVTYDPASIPALVATLKNLLDLNSATVVVVSATLRNQATFDGFLATCGTVAI